MLSQLTLIDYMFAFVVIISIIISVIRGFIREALSLATWGIAVWVTFTFAERLSNELSPYIAAEALRMGISIAVLFLVTFVLGLLCSYFITKLVSKSGLTGTDRLIGLIFGASRGVLIVVLAILGLSLTPIAQSAAWKDSAFIPQFQPMVSWLSRDFPEYMQQHGQQQLQAAHEAATDSVDDVIE